MDVFIDDPEELEVEQAVELIAPVVKALIMSSGDTLAMMKPDQLAIARQLAQGGLRLHSELATHKWLGDGGVMSGVWTPLDDAPPTPNVPDISGLSLAQKSAIAVQLQQAGIAGFTNKQPPPEGAEVIE